MSLAEIRRAGGVLETRLAGAVLQRIVQLDEFRLVLELYRAGALHNLLISCRPRFARIGLVGEMPKAPATPPDFVQFLRARLHRARLEHFTTYPGDRCLSIRLAARGGGFEILFSILGSRSNLYLLDGQRVLLQTMRPLAQTRRELVLGGAWVDPEGKPGSAGSDRWNPVADEDYLNAIEAAYSLLEQEEEATILARRVEQALKKESDFLERKEANLLRDLESAAQAEEYRRKGELLKLALHSMRRGDDSVTVIEHETGTPVEIALDSRLSPAENLKAYFKRYQKELRGAALLQQQLENLRNTRDAVFRLRSRLQDLQGSKGLDAGALRELSLEPGLRRLLARHAPVRGRRASGEGKKRRSDGDIPGRLRPRRYRTDQGLEIWVGRSEEGNDYLTTRLSRGNDLFFHLEGYPGSHVILRTEGKSDPPPEAILDACELAVHFSKLKHAGQADVHVTPVKNVRKPKGAKPGLVYVLRGKTVHLRRDRRRLENILSARLDE